METEYLTVDPGKPDPEVIKKAGKVLRRGGLVAFPTETVYGLGGDALNMSAAGRIYAAKGRPSDNPLIVHIADTAHLYPLVKEVPEGAVALARAYCPGPLTMIFKKTTLVPYATSGGLETVAVRMPSHPVARALIEAGGGYIAAPSANSSGRPSPTRADHVKADLDGRIDMILDGGEVNIGLESTIVDFTEEIPVILRPGYINKAMLEEILGEVRMDPGLSSENENVRPKAPGMRYRHYAPKAPLTVVEGAAEEVAAFIRKKASEAEEAGQKAGIICAEEHRSLYEGLEIVSAGHLENDEEIALGLYGILRDFDEASVDRIWSEAFDSPGLGDAIMNRLLKAAGHQVITV